MLVVAFQTNSFNVRGVESVLWTYADMNEWLLGNKSVIVVRKGIAAPGPDVDDPSFKKFFESAFETHELSDDEIEPFLARRGVDVVVVSNSGGNDNFVPGNVPSVVRCVFTPDFPQGTLHTAVSNLVCAGKIPVLPDIVRVSKAKKPPSLRAELGIPENAIVYGRIGGFETFDVPFVRDVVRRVSAKKDIIYFLLVNTDPKGLENLGNVKFFKATRDDAWKKRFFEACDYFLHARADGETFGVACGEFALCDKPTISYAHSPDREHFTILGDKIVPYADADDLERILLDPPKIDMTGHGYERYTPERVAPRFKLALCHAISRFHGGTLGVFY
jgi:hypothetical protein